MLPLRLIIPLLFIIGVVVPPTTIGATRQPYNDAESRSRNQVRRSSHPFAGVTVADEEKCNGTSSLRGFFQQRRQSKHLPLRSSSSSSQNLPHDRWSSWGLLPMLPSSSGKKDSMPNTARDSGATTSSISTVTHHPQKYRHHHHRFFSVLAERANARSMSPLSGAIPEVLETLPILNNQTLGVGNSARVRGIGVLMFNNTLGEPERALVLSYHTMVVLYFPANESARVIMGEKDKFGCRMGPFPTPPPTPAPTPTPNPPPVTPATPQPTTPVNGTHTPTMPHSQTVSPSVSKSLIPKLTIPEILEMFEPEFPAVLNTSSAVQPGAIEVVNGRTILFTDAFPGSRVLQLSPQMELRVENDDDSSIAEDLLYFPHNTRVLRPVGALCNYTSQSLPIRLETDPLNPNSDIYVSEPSQHVQDPEFTLYLPERNELFFTQKNCIAVAKSDAGVFTFYANCTQKGNRTHLLELHESTARDALHGPTVSRSAARSAYPAQMVSVGDKLYVAEPTLGVIREIGLTGSYTSDAQSAGARVVLGKVVGNATMWPPPSCAVGAPCKLLETLMISASALAAVIDPVDDVTNHTILYVGDRSTGVVYRANLQLNEVIIVAGQMLRPGFENGNHAVSRLSVPRQFAVTSDTLYIADGNHIRRMALPNNARGLPMIVPNSQAPDRKTCTNNDHCNGRAQQVFGLPAVKCTCICRETWSGPTCAVKTTRTKTITVMEPEPLESCEKGDFTPAEQVSSTPSQTEGHLRQNGLNVSLIFSVSSTSKNGDDEEEPLHVRFYYAAVKKYRASATSTSNKLVKAVVPAKLIQAPQSDSIPEETCLGAAPGGALEGTLHLLSPTTSYFTTKPFPNCELYLAEEASVEVPADLVLGQPCTPEDGDVSVARFKIEASPDPDLSRTNEANTVTTVVASVGSILGGGAGVVDQQALAVASMMYCGGASEKKMLSNFRLLAPLATEQSFIGVIFGNLILIGGILVIEALVIVVKHHLNKRQHAKEIAAAADGISTPPQPVSLDLAMATARFPSIPHKVVVVTFQGTTFAAFQLMVAPKSPVDTSIGASLAFSCVSYLMFLIWFSYWRIRGEYHQYLYEEWKERKFPKLLTTLLLPSGFWSPHSFRARFAGWVTSVRREEKLWVTAPMWGSALMSIASLFRLERAGCVRMFAVIGSLHAIIGLIHLAFRPHRNLALNIMGGLASFAVGVFLGLTSSNIHEPTHEKVQYTMYVAQFQIALTMMRLIMNLASVAVERFVLRKADNGLPTKLVFRWEPPTSKTSNKQKNSNAPRPGEGGNNEEEQRNRATSLDQPMMARPHRGPNSTTNGNSNSSSEESFLKQNRLASSAAHRRVPPFNRAHGGMVHSNSDQNILSGDTSPNRIDSILGTPTRPNAATNSSSESFEEQMKAIQQKTFLEANDSFFIPEGEFVANSSRIGGHKHELHEVLRKGLNSHFVGGSSESLLKHNSNSVDDLLSSPTAAPPPPQSGPVHQRMLSAGSAGMISNPSSPTSTMNRQLSSISGGSTGFEAGSFAMNAGSTNGSFAFPTVAPPAAVAAVSPPRKKPKKKATVVEDLSEAPPQQEADQQKSKMKKKPGLKRCGSSIVEIIDEDDAAIDDELDDLLGEDEDDDLPQPPPPPQPPTTTSGNAQSKTPAVEDGKSSKGTKDENVKKKSNDNDESFDDAEVDAILNQIL